jgi:hypothetical protein
MCLFLPEIGGLQSARGFDFFIKQNEKEPKTFQLLFEDIEQEHRRTTDPEYCSTAYWPHFRRAS